MTVASPIAVMAVGVTPTEARALPMGSRKRVTRGRTLVSITTQQSSRPGLVVRSQGRVRIGVSHEVEVHVVTRESSQRRPRRSWRERQDDTRRSPPLRRWRHEQTGDRGTGHDGARFEPEEIDRGISLGLGAATFNWNDHRINLIDTPGSSDFSGDARAALRAVDLALFVVSGVDGVEVQTEQLWKVAEEEGIPRAVVGDQARP